MLFSALPSGKRMLTNMPGSNSCFGLGNSARNDYAARARIDRKIGEQQLARLRIDAAVIKHQFNFATLRHASTCRT